MMNWIYWSKLYDTKFQANCLLTRIEQDWWIRGYDAPKEVEIFQVKSGRFGVRFSWDS
jgi:hypothetical protein